MKIAGKNNHRNNHRNQTCDKCSNRTCNLVQVVKTRPNKNPQPQQQQQIPDSFQKYIPNEYYEDLCPNCLVGHTVPVFRQTLNEWNMGIVQVFDEFDEEYLVQYLDQSKEWTNISRRPMSSYLSYWKSEYKDDTNNEPSQLNSRQSVDSSLVRSRHSGTISPVTNDNNDERHKDVYDLCQLSDFSAETELCNTDSSDSCSTFRRIDDIELDKNVCGNTVNPSPIESARLISPKNTYDSDNRQKKKSTEQIWTKKNDQCLIDALERATNPIKWAHISKLFVNKSQQQCQARYLYHIIPSLNSKRWKPNEDRMIFRIIQHQDFQSYDIAQKTCFKGRSIDDLRQRHHHLLQLLEAHFTKSEHFFQCRKDFSLETATNECFEHSGTEDATLAKKMKQVLLYLAFVPKQNTQCDFPYGPYIKPNKNGSSCRRCAFFVPSIQTGKSFCMKSGWCESCTNIPIYISDEIARYMYWVKKNVTRYLHIV